MRQVEVSRTIVFDAPRRAGPSSRRWWPTTWTSAARTTSGSSSTGNIDRNTTGHLPHQRRDPGRRRHPERQLQALADQGVPQGGPGPAHRDRRATPPTTSAASAAFPTSPSSRPRPAPPTDACWTIQRVGQSCAISTSLLERVALPTVEGGPTNRSLRFGDPRVMALAGALCTRWCTPPSASPIGAFVPG